MKADAAARVHMLRRQLEQVAMLRAAEADAEAAIQRLEPVLDLDRVTAHVRAALARVEAPDRGATFVQATDVLPRDAYQTLIDLIPAAVFFDTDDAGRQQLRIPPRLAPVPSIVAWTFLTEVVLRVLAPALVDRLRAPLGAVAAARFPRLPPFDQWNVDVTLSQGRLVRGGATAGRVVADDRWELFTGRLVLAPLDAGSANVLQAWLDTPPPADPAWYAYEFGVGPTRDGRRRLSTYTE